MPMKLSITTHDSHIAIQTTQWVFKHTHTCSLRAHLFRHQQSCTVLTSWPSTRLKTLHAPTTKHMRTFKRNYLLAHLQRTLLNSQGWSFISIASNKTDTHTCTRTHAALELASSITKKGVLLPASRQMKLRKILPAFNNKHMHVSKRKNLLVWIRDEQAKYTTCLVAVVEANLFVV